MQPITQGLCRWRARNSSRISPNLSSRSCVVTQPKQWGIVNRAYYVARYTFTHESFFSTIILKRPPTALGSNGGGPREDAL
jgi:hypothetical protein